MYSGEFKWEQNQRASNSETVALDWRISGQKSGLSGNRKLPQTTLQIQSNNIGLIYIFTVKETVPEKD